MIRLGLNRRDRTARLDGENEESPFLIPGQAPRLSTRFKPARFLGNFLIIAGLVMLVGIGGWYGYTQWDNQRQKEEIASKFGKDHVDPSANQASASAQAIAIAPALLPALNNLGLGISVQGATLLKREDSSPPVRLVIPSVKIDSKVVPITWKMIPAKSGEMKSEWQVADYAVGHHFGTANPGEIGNVVLSGHVDYKGQVFKDLHNVNKGDEVTVFTEKGQYIYVVTDMVLVKEEGVSDEQKRENARYMDPTPDQTLTMITCWPYGIDDHRLIVIAKPYQSPLSTQADFVIR